MANLEGYPARSSLCVSLNFMDLKEWAGEKKQRNKASSLHGNRSEVTCQAEAELHDTECVSVANEVLIGTP